LVQGERKDRSANRPLMIVLAIGLPVLAVEWSVWQAVRGLIARAFVFAAWPLVAAMAFGVRRAWRRDHTSLSNSLADSQHERNT